MAYNELLSKLAQNLLEILDDKEHYDITIEVGNDPNIKIFHAHIVILKYRSPYLRKILSTNEKTDGTLINIKLPNILPKTFQIILRYIYGGKLSLEEYDTSDIINLLIAVKELDLQELIPYIETFLIENKKDWMVQNFDLIYRKSFETDSFPDLRKFCFELISHEPNKIFNSPKFSSIPENLLITLIQNENVRMSEVQVWEHVINWGLAQNPELSTDLKNYSKEDFNALKNILQHCIPFIKFQNLTSKEFSSKVLPYKKVLPKDLYKELLAYFLENDTSNHIMSKNIDSKIITLQHTELISRWIDRLEITDKLLSLYNFELLFRGSRDGFTPSNFHEICDNESRTITIFKVRGSNEILGGYNPIEWTSGGFSSTKNSFIFSFKDSYDTENFIISRVKNESNAIYNSPCFGPSFGSKDLLSSGLKVRCKKSSYEKSIRETCNEELKIEEFEVFRII
ncbi:hypothetical protein RclHR1_00690023 [Rhizophagus clarus]|uniref:Carbohydrate-binding module family 13 protein n=1 Tax=Rhizophagus clarus TaxID=94130 RepID=A0A2Z6S0B3_9GLOM|nr:hypothetical protein RclHR1_00690023 [Rhizophagus clarus]GES83703.1 carbohydrate-binding module family 13 protein [Rhizophagus clarus]